MMEHRLNHWSFAAECQSQIVILIIAGITLLNVLNKIFVWCKLPQLQFGDVEITDDQLREGR